MSTFEQELGVGTEPVTSQTLTPEDAAKFAEDAARLGVPAEKLNEHLKAMGVRPLDMAEGAVAQREIDRLKADPVFAAKLNAGDPDANARLNALVFSATYGAKTETTPTADEYRFDYSPALEAMRPDDAKAWETDHRELFSNLGLSQELARAITSEFFDGAERFSRMSTDEQENYGVAQTGM